MYLLQTLILTVDVLISAITWSGMVQGLSGVKGMAVEMGQIYIFI